MSVKFQYYFLAHLDLLNTQRQRQIHLTDELLKHQYSMKSMLIYFLLKLLLSHEVSIQSPTTRV